MRKAVIMLRGQTANGHHLQHLVPQFCPATQLMLQHRLTDGVADANAWIQRAIRVLEDQLHFWPQRLALSRG